MKLCSTTCSILYWSYVIFDDDKNITKSSNFRYTEHSTVGLAQQWDQLDQLGMRMQHNLEQQIQARYVEILIWTTRIKQNTDCMVVLKGIVNSYGTEGSMVQCIHMLIQSVFPLIFLI